MPVQRQNCVGEQPCCRTGFTRTLAGMSESTDADAELMLRVQRGDRAAFDLLMERWQQPVLHFIFRTLPDTEEAEDLTQAVFVQLWRTAPRYQPSARFSTFLFTIARNLRIDAIRREKRPELDPEDFMPDSAPAADESLVQADDESRLRLALKDLPADQIQVVELSFFADKPHSQIATELGIPLGTVKSRLRLAMSRLKRALGEVE